MESIPAVMVGQKINEWYRHIKRLNVTDAEMLRNEKNGRPFSGLSFCANKITQNLR